jgi:hypothetical protein
MEIGKITSMALSEKAFLEQHAVRFACNDDGSLCATLPEGTRQMALLYPLLQGEEHSPLPQMFERSSEYRLPGDIVCVLLEAQWWRSYPDALEYRSLFLVLRERTYLVDRAPCALDELLLRLGGCKLWVPADGIYGKVLLTLPQDVQMGDQRPAPLHPDAPDEPDERYEVDTHILLPRPNRIEIVLSDCFCPASADEPAMREVSVSIPAYESCCFPEALQDSQHWMKLYGMAQDALNRLFEQTGRSV